MPNQLTATGLETDTAAELLSFLTTQFQSIYGADVDLSSSTPDGQWIGIIIQAILDLEDLLTQIYNGFDPDQAIGTTLDMRCALNGIQRQAGTFTLTNITLVLSQSVNLYGLDQDAQPVYTVSDNAGNQFQLITSNLGVGPATVSYGFQASAPGAVQTTPNTITVPVTVVLGVTSVNNPTAATTVGLNEETDAQLKIRRQKSVAIPSQGYLAGLLAALENVSGVTYASVLENVTGSTDANGVPGHSIWCILAGAYANADIAQAIYTKRNAGCGMKGAVTYNVVQVDGSSFTVKWDTVALIPLFITFTATSLDKVNPPNIAAITSGLPSKYLPAVAAQVNATSLGTAVQAIDPNTFVTSAGFSIATVQVITFSGIAASGAFKLSYGASSTASISWNDTNTTIQTRLRALAGLGSITVSGSIAGQSITVTMTGVSSPTLIGYNTNTLLTGGSAVVSLLFMTDFTNTLTPAAKNDQFGLTASEVVVVSMILSGGTGIAYNINSTTGVVTNTTLAITHADTFTFVGLGGYGTLTYSVTTSTGSTINASTGLYTAGTAGTDTVKVVGSLGNSATCTVTIS